MVKLNKHARMRARQRVRGESYAVVASDYGVSPAGLWKALKTTEKDREKIGETRGRKPALTEAQVKRVQKFVQKKREKNKEVSYALIRRHFKLRVSDTTLKKRVMKPMDYGYRLRARKPAFSAETRGRRLIFGRKMLKEGGARKTLVRIDVACDNFDVCQPIKSRVEQRARAWMGKSQKERLKPYNTAPPRQNKAPKAHMLPIIALKGGRRGKGKLLACPIYKRMNVQTAHDLFKKHLIPALKRHYRGKKKFVICFDGCKCMNNQDTVKPLLKKAGIEVAFRGQNKANPQAPGQLSDWYPIENVNGWVKDKILVALNNSPKWRHGASVTKANMEAWEKFCQKQYLKVLDTEIKACYGKWEERTETLVQKQGGGMRF